MIVIIVIEFCLFLSAVEIFVSVTVSISLCYVFNSNTSISIVKPCVLSFFCDS